MHDLIALLPSGEAIRGFLGSPHTWWQIGAFLAGVLAAASIGRWLQTRLHPIIQPGVMTGVRRVAMRTGVLALIPLILWLWLIGAVAVFRRWDIATDVLRPAMLLAGALAVIRMGVFVLRHSFSPGSKLKAWEGIFTFTIWVLVALHILGWLPHIREILDDYALTVGNVRLSLYTVSRFALSIAALLLIALWISNAIQWRVAKSKVLDDSIKIALSKLTKFTLLTLAVLTAMIAAGIDLTAFAVFGGALGVGLGLGLQRIVSNFVSGIILAFEGSIRPGDVITMGNTFGTVRALHARHIVVRTRDGLDILVPNENLLTSEITNWSYDDRNVRLRLPVQISYSDDPEQVIALLHKLALEHPRVLKEPAPTVVLLRFGDNGIDIELRVWVNDPEAGTGNVRSDVNRSIWRAFKAAGISIPFPQRDVYIKAVPQTVAASVPRVDKPRNRAKSAHGRKPARKAGGPD